MTKPTKDETQDVLWRLLEQPLRRSGLNPSRLGAKEQAQVVAYAARLLADNASKIAYFAGELVEPTDRDEREAVELLDTGVVELVWEPGLLATVDLQRQEVVRVWVGACDFAYSPPDGVYPELPPASSALKEARAIAKTILLDEEGIPLTFMIERAVRHV